jgi:2'-5' RNA ligase
MRLFVALELPEGQRRRLAELPERQRWIGLERANLNWVRAENLHVTLKFLGSVPEEQVQAVCNALAEVRIPGPIGISVGGLAFLPPRGPMRVLVAELGGELDRLGVLQSEIERAMEPLGFERERRAYRPHVTVARPCRGGRVPPEFREDVREHPGPRGSEFPVDSFVLMQSDLKPGGAVYTPIARFPLQI